MEEFRTYLINNDRKAKTIYRHLANLKRLQLFCPHLTIEEVENYYTTLREQGCKNTYLNSLTSTVRTYGHFTNNPGLEGLRFRKKELFSKATMSDDEIETFLNLPPERVNRLDGRTGKPVSYILNPKGYQQWSVFFSIMAFSGLRPGEVAALKVDDVDFGRQVFVVRDSKTNTPRVAPIAPNILTLIKEFIETKESILFAGVDNCDWHFNFHKRLNRLGIKRANLTPYSLRHSYATRLLESNVSLFHVKKLMGHSDLKSTLVYEHLTTKDLIEAVQKLPLVRRGTEPKTILQAMVELIKSFKVEQDERFSYSIEEKELSLKFEMYIKH